MLSLTRICSGEVAITVWTRPRLPNFTASAQRSISFGFARDRPAMTEFFERLAISLTAWKSPSEVIGKPASMTSTPMSSSISAMSSFSSKVMVAPGHCSPSRKVVSNMMTRSFSDLTAEVIGKFLQMVRHQALGVGCFVDPLRSQAHAPRRLSGADKKKQPAAQQGGNGRSRNGGADRRSPYIPVDFAANQHCQPLREAGFSGKTVDGWLPSPCPATVLDENRAQSQRQ